MEIVVIWLLKLIVIGILVPIGIGIIIGLKYLVIFIKSCFLENIWLGISAFFISISGISFILLYFISNFLEVSR